MDHFDLMFLGPQPQNEQEEKDLETYIKWHKSMMARQHDDHIWLTVGGRAWAIYAMNGTDICLWRGYHPYIEYSYLDISKVDWESYHRKALKILFPEIEDPF
jgi:hypothetical protein